MPAEEPMEVDRPNADSAAEGALDVERPNLREDRETEADPQPPADGVHIMAPPEIILPEDMVNMSLTILGKICDLPCYCCISISAEAIFDLESNFDATNYNIF